MTALVSLYKTPFQKEPIEDKELDDVLQLVKAGYWQDAFFAYKNGKIEKRSLPCYTTSGTFGKERKASKVLQHSGVINIDIDKKHNEEINLVEFKDTLSGDKYIYAAHVSVSGEGLSLYVKINPEKHAESFLSLEQYFADKYSIVIDPSGKDISRLRFISYDPDLYMNTRSAVYRGTVKKAAIEYVRRNIPFTDDDIEYILQQIERDKRDLTASYADWVKIAFALNSEYGPAGEGYFQRISMFHPNYDQYKTSIKYKQCAGENKAIGIASFFWIVKEAGYDIVSKKTKDIKSAARYRKKDVSAGNMTKDTAKESVADYAKTVHGDPDAGHRIASAIIDGGDDEKETADDIYEWVTKDIADLKLRKNALEGCIEHENVPIDDEWVNAEIHKLRKKYGHKKVSREMVEIIISAEATTYDPVIDFFKRNKHRKPSGCIDSICDTIKGTVNGLTDDESRDYRRYFIKKWLLGAISCWHGTYSLLTLVFVSSEHGTGKTRWIRNLLPYELQRYFAEAKMDGDKDHLGLMVTKLILFDDEFSGKSKKEAALLKELSAKQNITIRRPYGKRPETCVRKAVFCGSTNDEGVLNDPTGNRRILAFQVDSIDWDAYDAVDKTDLFMELYHEWLKTGDSWMLSKDDIGLISAAHKPFEETCAEEELLRKYFVKGGDGLTNTEIANALQGKLTGGSIRISQRKLGMVLKKLGYEQKIVWNNGTTSRVYAIQEKSTSVICHSDEPGRSNEPCPF